MSNPRPHLSAKGWFVLVSAGIATGVAFWVTYVSLPSDIAEFDAGLGLPAPALVGLVVGGGVLLAGIRWIQRGQR